MTKTNFGKQFLQILDKSFPKGHRLNKLLNRRTVKLSYSCTKNMNSIISNHNRKVTETENKPIDRNCNCRDKQQCPLKGKCCATTVVYKAELDLGQTKKTYIGCTEGEFKTRFNGHSDSFRNEKKKNSTTLSTIVWKQSQNPRPNIEWSIVKKVNKYKPGLKSCDLCLTEKLYILKESIKPENINKRIEASSLCVHRNRYKLANIR